MKKLIFNILAVLLAILPGIISAQKAELAKPSEKQIRFADWEVGAFFHYDLNVFTGMEHGDGQFPPSMFNPTELNVEQWVLTAKAMGAKYACLTVRHEGGFCLWPSKSTDYTIANSPYKNGKGDLVREFVDACRKYGIVPTFYHTAGFDANAAIGKYKGDLKLPLEWMSTWGQAVSEGLKRPGQREKFKQIQVEQMRELLTNYGPIGFMWSDHWDATDPNGVWRAVTDLAKELQPDMVFMGPETWVPGNETGHVVYPMWNAVNTKDGTNYSRPAATSDTDGSTKNNYGLLETDVLSGHPLGKYWRVRECTTNSGFAYGGWFWHPDSIKKTYPKRLWEHLDLYYRTVGLGANTIINLTPDNRGLIPDDIVDAAKKFGNAIRERFANPIAETEGIKQGKIVELDWVIPMEINTVVTMENIANGQKVVKYTLEAFVDGNWKTLEPKNRLDASKPYNANPGYETIGHKKIDRVEPVLTHKIRFRCFEAVADDVEIRKLAVFNNPPIIRTFNAGYPYLSGVETSFEVAHGGIRRDVDYKGEKIELDGKVYEYGLMVCPLAADKKGVAEFEMKNYPKAKGLTAVIGIEDMTGDAGSCEFIVKAFQNGKWNDLYKSQRLTGKDSGVKINVDFPVGVEKIQLYTTLGGDNASSDHAVWADAKFFE